jgi:hypothetical protein
MMSWIAYSRSVSVANGFSTVAMVFLLSPELGDRFLPLIEDRFVPEHPGSRGPGILFGRVKLQRDANPRAFSHDTTTGHEGESELPRFTGGRVRATLRPDFWLCELTLNEGASELRALARPTEEVGTRVVSAKRQREDFAMTRAAGGTIEPVRSTASGPRPIEAKPSSRER